MGVLGFDLGFRVSEICLFLCSSLMRFLWYKFFIFQDCVWLVKKLMMCSMLLHSSILLTKRSLQKRICAVMVFCPKKVVTVLAVFLSFWS